MRSFAFRSLIALLALQLPSAPVVAQAPAQPAGGWPQHSADRPRPPVVTPARQDLPVAAPAGAVVLFDGKDLTRWQDGTGGSARWRLAAGLAMEVAAGTGDISTRDGFGDVELHVEWASPKPARGADQDRGNSGVFLMGMYEVQVLDSYENITYADGQAAAIYGQFPPLVNVSRPPGEWQTYDIVFTRPRFDDAGKLVSPARATVRHNGVLVQDNVVLLGPTTHMVRTPYSAHADRLPIKLQDHGHPVQFRNIWLRDLEGRGASPR